MIIRGHVIDSENFAIKHFGEYNRYKRWVELSDLNYNFELRSRKTDKDIISNKSTMKKYSSKIKLETDLIFDFYLFDIEIKTPKKEHGFGYELLSRFKPKDDKTVSIVFNGNWGANYYPFTPWILMHRSFHTISQFNIRKTKSYNLIQNLVKRIVAELVVLEENFLSAKNYVYIKKNYDNIFGSADIFNDLKYYGNPDNHSNYLFPFRSARMNMRLMTIDLVCELFAQKFLQGEISFFDVMKIPDLVVPNHNKSELREVYMEQEDKVNKLYDDIISLLPGNIFTMV